MKSFNILCIGCLIISFVDCVVFCILYFAYQCMHIAHWTLNIEHCTVNIVQYFSSLAFYFVSTPRYNESCLIISGMRTLLRDFHTTNQFFLFLCDHYDTEFCSYIKFMVSKNKDSAVFAVVLTFEIGFLSFFCIQQCQIGTIHIQYLSVVFAILTYWLMEFLNTNCTAKYDKVKDIKMKVKFNLNAN